ncbi:MAG TPA: efflux RND transporter periplasmic adaptor subunit [Candidatus Acidoferrum sp.]|nr:efflux RND transporter periplasmic adaptor subunit [Candidatus Acidoferrum sp.]
MSWTSPLGGRPRLLFLGSSSLLILILLPFFFSHFRRAQASANPGESTFRVEKKNFTQTLRLNGTTMASRSFAVLAPRLEGAQVGSMVITKLAPAGSQVKKDDLLAEFDPQAQMKDYLDKKSSYDNLAGQVAQKQAEEEIARAKDDTAMKQAEDELKRAQLELQRNEIVSRIDAEKNQEAADEAQATLKQLKETYQLKRAAATAGIRILEIQRDRALESMRYAQSNAAKMTVRSPMPGVVVYNTIWLGGRMGTVQLGDEVRPGLPFMAVVDPSQMEVRVELNQVDVLHVYPGMHAKMHLDAYPGLSFVATLEDLSPLGHTGQFTETVRTFTARFSVQGSDPKLLPDLSAALDLELGSQGNVLVIPRSYVESDAGNSYVWVKATGSFEKRAVKTGPASDLDVVVLSGLQEGEIIRQLTGEQP